MFTKPTIHFLLFYFSLIIFSSISCSNEPINEKLIVNYFNQERALLDLKFQTDLGPRHIGSPGHEKIIQWIKQSLDDNNLNSYIQNGEIMGHPVQNIIGVWGEGAPWIILGAHYDTRLVADNDPDPEKQSLPVPGANDGASGVTVLLEISRNIPENFPGTIWFTFFDAEDNGNIPGWDWVLGSRYFVQNLENYPDAMILVDMVGDSSLNIYKERNSSQYLTEDIWEKAAELGYGEFFIPESKYRIIDDHLPFVQAGIPAVDIIDFDYPYYHTVEDTYDKISAESLRIVGDTLILWLGCITHQTEFTKQ